MMTRAGIVLHNLTCIKIIQQQEPNEHPQTSGKPRPEWGLEPCTHNTKSVKLELFHSNPSGSAVISSTNLTNNILIIGVLRGPRSAEKYFCI